ncbi:hypothetical protein [Kaistella palustris]|uniref:hypothetical protein n=1 Tax=Kaistella palustris TaxID=493376 RepID=UPI0012EB9999|nr:hypothetical protein [Kaistella palustris]
MKYKYLFVLFFAGSLVFAQERKPMKEGTLTTVTGEKIPFKDLTWKNGKAYYINASNKLQEELFEPSIKEITDQFPNPESSGNTSFSAAEIASLKKTSLPEGIYATKADFAAKQPSKIQKLTKKGLIGFEKTVVNDDALDCFFYDQTTDRKLKNVFAVVYNGDLYFNVQSILNNRNKTDRAQGSDFPNSFTKVTIQGENYFYTEVVLANIWAKGLAYNMGPAGGAMASTLNQSKGVVWDVKNDEFNIFKNCADYNDFIRDKAPHDILNCKNDFYDQVFVRRTIEKIK